FQSAFHSNNRFAVIWPRKLIIENAEGQDSHHFILPIPLLLPKRKGSGVKAIREAGAGLEGDLLQGGLRNIDLDNAEPQHEFFGLDTSDLP
ncbi:hypothetical protein EJB05_07583, partial [Eragrostis curvula]